ncbi:hypothetical protein N6H13_22640 [Paenibacillus sp. CC-CFT742]|nr:hypothetical protein [Paenibacillus sp. CC-CFT742]WJH27922.1 hypothetical protein N6H13_22640 [Paenibacillus sp. CC-CFT742]
MADGLLQVQHIGSPGGFIPPGDLHGRRSGHARTGQCGGQTPILRLAGHPSMMHLTPGHIL